LIIIDLSVVTVLSILGAVASLEEVALILHGLYSGTILGGISATGCKFMFEKASLSFSN
jgi:hypothetical protein